MQISPRILKIAGLVALVPVVVSFYITLINAYISYEAINALTQLMSALAGGHS